MPCGMNGRGSFSNDLIKSCQIYVTPSKIVAAPHVVVSGAVSYIDASVIGMTPEGIPTFFPEDGSSLFFFLNRFERIPAWRYGIYDVTFTPGLEWAFSGGAAATRTAYNSVAGTATIIISSADDHISFTLQGYQGVSRTLPAPEDFYFRAFKQGADPEKLVAAEYKAALAPFAGGHIRMMESNNTNRPAIAGVSYGVVNAWLDNNSATWNLFSAPLPPEVLVELAVDCGMKPWDNLWDTASDAAIMARASRFVAAMPSEMNLYVEYSNEMWQTANPGFTQASGLNTRAVAAGVDLIVQYARELKAKILLYKSVFTGQLERLKPVFAWQSGIAISQLTLALNEGNLYQEIYGCAIAPYGGGGIGGYDTGNYSNTVGFSTSDRDLVLTDAEAFKDAAFASLDLANKATLASWYDFVNSLRTYCTSKGLSRTALRPMTYEQAAQHIVERNTPTAASQQTLTRNAFAEMLRDIRMGVLTVTQIDRLLDAGADLCFFDLSSKATGGSMVFGIWGTMDTITDTAQEPYASIASYLTATPEPAARSFSAQGVLS